jgi:hypothetical protein
MFRYVGVAMFGIFLVASSAHGQRAAGALEGFGRALEDISRGALEEDRQRRLMEQQHRLNMERMDREVAAERERIERQAAYERARREQLAREYQEAQLLSQAKDQITEQRRYIRELESRIDRLEKDNAILAHENQKVQVYRKYPTWEQIVGTPRFSAWLNQQPPYVRDLGQSHKASDALRLLDMYSASTQGKAK